MFTSLLVIVHLSRNKVLYLQGRSERGGVCGGGGGASPPNNMSQSANYTHTTIRIGKTEKLDKDYVL